MSNASLKYNNSSIERARKIFKNRFGHYRAGWRILIYFAFVIALFELSDLLESSLLIIKGDNLGDYLLLQNRFVNKFLKLLSVFIPSVVLLKWFDKRPVPLLGIGFYKESFRELLVGMIMGLILGIVSISILWSSRVASFSFNGFSMDMLLYLLFCLGILVISAAYEEILFRGYIFQSLLEGSNLWITLGAFSLLFGAFHFEHGAGAMAFAAIAGIFLGVLYYKTRTLWMCIGVHFMWNWIQAPLFGMGVSESKFLRRSLFDYQPFESNIFGGADAIGVLIQGLLILVLTIYIWKARWIKPAEYNRRMWAKYHLKYGTDPI